MGRLATAYGFNQSTLRNQWRRVRADPTLRLEDVLRCVALAKVQSRTMSNQDLRTVVNQRIRRMFGRLMQEAAKCRERFIGDQNDLLGC